MDWIEVIILLVKILVVAVALLSGFAVMTWFERRLIAGFQVRIGPNRVGPLGLLQPAADGLKLAMKEDLTPSQADRVVFVLAPMVSMTAALVAFSVVPFGPPDFRIFGRLVPLHIAADLSIGFLMLLAVASLGIYGIVLAGWSSGSKYSLLGGLRSSAQMISYELAMGLALVSVLIAAGSVNTLEIASKPALWLAQFPAFVIFFICMIAETNRAPFDLAEAEQELVAGFHTEYASFKFALFYMGEYVNMITFSALAVVLFFGAWHGPFVDRFPLLGVVWFLAKIVVFMFVYVWIRATLPRIRYDRLMSLGWKVLLPASLLWVMITATWVTFVK
ncbi:MAG: NADH-quinone oxidoreductase subunit NuoH [Armatimonadetes bacterium]|mgnify:CR=1 FL=1|nr:NADH-quinone oxidoreductase subunit NuoH [Armatimonadota bacterium]HOC31976.1 NADH-quinone oxidoreductase subunit NuoH [Armatimonadota bacterium]